MADENEDYNEEPIEGTILDPEAGQSDSGQDQQEPETIRLEPHEYGEPTHRAREEKKLFPEGDPRDPNTEKKERRRQERRVKKEKKLHVEPEPMSGGSDGSSKEDLGPEDFISDNFDDNDPWVREMRREQAERDAAAKGRKTYSFEGSRLLSDGLVDTGDPEADLRANVNRAGKVFMDEVVNQTGEDASKAIDKARRQELYDNMSSKHKMYTMMMGMSCLAGLRNGVTPSAVLRSATMAGTMWACSPNFRHVIGGMIGPKLEPMQEKLKGAIDGRIEKRKEKERKKVGKKVAKADEKGKPLSKLWERRLEKSLANKDGRMPFTVQSAAMTEVAMNEGFFKSLRKPGANVDSLRDTHRFVMEKLYTEAAADGISSDSISRASRTLIGHQVQDNPMYAAMYGELAHGSFERSPEKTVRIEGTDQTAQMWNGDFNNDFGQKVTSGSFSVRGPMGSSEHQSRIAQTIAGDMLSTKNVTDFNASMVGYGLGMKMEIDPEDRHQLRPEVAGRMDRSDLFHNAMRVDGIETEEMEKVYSNAYLDALEIVRSRNPDLEQEWTERYGAGWQERFNQFMEDPQGFMKREKDDREAREKWGPRGEPFAPEPKESSDSTRPDQQEEEVPNFQTTAGKFRRAKRNQGYNKVDTGRWLGWGSDDYDPGEDFQLGG